MDIVDFPLVLYAFLNIDVLAFEHFKAICGQLGVILRPSWKDLKAT